MVTGVADTMVVVAVADVALVTISSAGVTGLPVGSVSKVTFLIAVAVPVLAAAVVVGIPVVVVAVVVADVVISLTAGVNPVTVGFAVVFSIITIGDSSDTADVDVLSKLRGLVSTATNANNQHNVGLLCIIYLLQLSVQFYRHENDTFFKIWHKKSSFDSVLSQQHLCLVIVKSLFILVIF